MIQYNPKSWFGLIFKFHKSDTFRQLLPAMASVALYSGGVAFLELEILELKFRSSTALHSMLGFVISLLLVFRTNTAYERWWEGRKLWGSLVNNCRNLAMKLAAMLGEGEADKKKVMALLSVYPNVLKEHLRSKKTEYAPQEVHQPNFISAQLIAAVNSFYQSGKISGEQYLILNGELSSLADICGGCERIKKTPIPYSYSLFLKKFIFVYIMTMPFGFIREFGYGIVPAVTFIFYVLASLELIAEEIEDPFGLEDNDLPTDEIAETIASNIKEITSGKN